jgi:hypothetical protein
LTFNNSDNIISDEMAKSTSSVTREEDIQSVINKIDIIKKTGFGEVRVLIKNGLIYRILSTEDEIIKKE